MEEKKKAKKVKCWEVFKCDEFKCPAFKIRDLKCWLIPGTHCRKCTQGKFLEKMELCIKCKVFKKNMSGGSVKATLQYVAEQFSEYSKLNKRREEESESSRQALSRSEERLRDIVSNAGEWIWEVDTAGRYTYSSPTVEKILGYTADEMIGKFFYDLFLPEEKESLKEKAFEVFSRKKVFHGFINNNLHKDGHTVIVETTGVPLLGTDGELTGYRGVDRDITERKRGEQELKNAYDQLKRAQSMLLQSSKMAAVGQLASGVAHEINNPLTGVLNNVQLIKMEMDAKHDFKSEEFKDLLSVIEESALRCKNIVRSLLDFSHSSTGQFQTLSLNEISEKVTGLIENEMRLQKVTIQKVLYPELPRIFGDSQLIQQVIFNVISNAKWAIQKKSSGDGGIITIETGHSPKDNSVTVSISDTGIGISRKNLEHIFEPFFTTKAVGEGTGLGLSVAYNIVRQHNGSIKIESEEGEGTTITMSFPVLKGN
ncbi:MAG: PAS domain S-box protein [Candidatus Omnitrophica bacterium]|nr:PAS domain S-box protein [Candidatus Omnitrophota bacterium]